jgi:dethiobiotin synthetase
VPGWLITGTDTGAGKTVLAAGMTAALRRSGRSVCALKPLLTGLNDPPEPVWGRDHELLAAVSGRRADEVVLASWGPAVSPHLAAELSAQPVPGGRRLAAAIRRAAAGAEVTIVEGVGGLLVPLAPGEDVGDLAAAVGLPLIIAARPGLGTINHTLLTLEAARRRGLAVTAVVLGPWPAQPDRLLRSNAETIAARGRVEVATYPEVAGPDPQRLADAGDRLPLPRWLTAQSS